MPVVLIVILSVILFIVLLVAVLLLVPVYVHIRYDDKLRLMVRLWGIPITVLPDEEADEEILDLLLGRNKKKKSRLVRLREEIDRSYREDGLEATVSYLGEVFKIVFGMLGRLVRAITVDHLRLEMTVSGADAADTAVEYGKMCATLYPILAFVEQAVTVRHREVRVEPNFLNEHSAFFADVRLHVAAGVAIVLQWKYLKKTLENE